MKVLVWDDDSYLNNPAAVAMHPNGIRNTIADFLKSDDVEVCTAVLADEECGLTEEVLRETDVLIIWSHGGNEKIPDPIVERVWNHILGGMGLIALHSSHFNKIFRKLMGTSCTLKWRMNVKERLWTIAPNHPIAQGVDETFALDAEEMYGEPFGIPNPDEVLFLGWFAGGEVFRSGCTFTRENGKIFYFQPGHEDNAAYYNENIQKIIKNAVKWACPLRKNIVLDCPLQEPLEQ